MFRFFRYQTPHNPIASSSQSRSNNFVYSGFLQLFWSIDVSNRQLSLMTGFSLRTIATTLAKIRQICPLKEEVEENVWHIQAPVTQLPGEFNWQRVYPGERFEMMLQHIAELYPVNDQLVSSLLSLTSDYVKK